MNFFLLYLLLLIDLIWFVHSNEEHKYEAVGVPVKKSFNGKETDVKYFIEDGFYSSRIDYTFEVAESETCFKFRRVDYHSDPNMIWVKYNTKCGVDIIAENGTFYTALYFNKKCESRQFLHKLIFKAIILRNKLFELIQKFAYNKRMPGLKNHLEISHSKYCKIDIKTKTLLIFTNILHNLPSYTISNNVLNDFHVKKDVEGITFSNVKHLNEKFCENSCKKPKIYKCYNSGFINPNTCSTCVCPMFFEGMDCKNVLEQKYPETCGKTFLNAEKIKKVKKITFKDQCVYQIKAKKGHKIKLTITPKSTLHYSCNLDPLIEIWLNTNKHDSIVYLCGTIKKYTTTSRGNNVLIYFTKLSKPRNFKLEYQSVKKYKNV